MLTLSRRTAALALLSLLLVAGPACAAELRVISSGGGLASLKAVAPEYQKQTGNHLSFDFGPSMGDTPNAIPQRLARGENIDALVMVGYALDKLVEEGKVTDPADVALSKIGAAVKQGAAKPDVSTVDGLRQAMLAAHTIAVSDSASGVYIQNEMIKKLGIEGQVRSKIRMIPADPVGGVVAKGEADLGFQQISELKPVVGIAILGPLPDAMQDVTLYKAGVVESSRQKELARAFIRFLTSPEAAVAIRESGLEPVSPTQAR
ncbi:MAG: substrate-binding domain-containing protein [Acetobacteraceae bacterium]|nr:substrate-binding domain-containing protein [Acetobacteraceae bacterium]